SVLSWLIDHFIALGVSAVIGAIGLVGLYVLIRWLPRAWWILAGLGSGVLIAPGAFILPVLIAPLFNTFTPLSTTEWAGLQPMVEALTAKAGLPVSDVLVMDASRQGKHTNAYFTGFGSTRQIVLYDTLLRSHAPDEVESILAHEMGHWLHQHIVKG